MNHGSNSSSSDCGLHCFQRRHNGQTGPEGLTALPLWTRIPIKGHEINFWDTAVPNVHMHSLRGEINCCFFHLFFTHSTDCSYLRLGLNSPTLCFYLPLTNMHTYTLEHTLPRAMWECLFIRQRPAAHLVTAQDGGVGSGQGVRGEEGQGGEGWVNGPTGLSFRACSTCTFQFI